MVLADVMRLYYADEMEACEVSSLVESHTYDRPQAIEPLA